MPRCPAGAGAFPVRSHPIRCGCAPGARPRPQRKPAGQRSGLPADPAACPDPPRRRAVPEYLSRRQADLLGQIGSQPVTAAQLAVQTGRPVGEILSSLSELEIYGLIESHGPLGYTAL